VCRLSLEYDALESSPKLDDVKRDRGPAPASEDPGWTLPPRYPHASPCSSRCAAGWPLKRPPRLPDRPMSHPGRVPQSRVGRSFRTWAASRNGPGGFHHRQRPLNALIVASGPRATRVARPCAAAGSRNIHHTNKPDCEPFLRRVGRDPAASADSCSSFSPRPLLRSPRPSSSSSPHSRAMVPMASYSNGISASDISTPRSTSPSSPTASARSRSRLYLISACPSRPAGASPT